MLSALSRRLFASGDLLSDGDENSSDGSYDEADSGLGGGKKGELLLIIIYLLGVMLMMLVHNSTACLWMFLA